MEDNTTKALINTLQYCSYAVSVRFLKWLEIDAFGKTNFALQRKTIGNAKIKGKSDKLLLGLIPRQTEKETNSNG